MFRVRIQIVSLCVSENQERGVVFVYATVRGGLIQDSEETHSLAFTQTHTQTLTYKLYCSSICVPPAGQFESVGHCSGGSKQNAEWLFSGWSDSSGAQILH